MPLLSSPSHSYLPINICLASMALVKVIASVLLTILATRVDLSTCHAVKGSVSCLDCDRTYNLSGIKVIMKCDKVKKLAMATTEDHGSFTTELPSDDPKMSPAPLNCHAKILGGPKQLYASRKTMVTKIVKAQDKDSFTLSTPLTISTTCPSGGKDGKCAGSASSKEFGASETVDLPLPKEWGLAPSSYYVPFFPIIGVP